MTQIFGITVYIKPLRVWLYHTKEYYSIVTNFLIHRFHHISSLYFYPTTARLAKKNHKTVVKIWLKLCYFESQMACLRNHTHPNVFTVPAIIYCFKITSFKMKIKMFTLFRGSLDFMNGLNVSVLLTSTCAYTIFKMNSFFIRINNNCYVSKKTKLA